ncbi:MAG: DnaJ domain-containing protein [Myxococcota bacterium]|nr:DnaJ domain-containing protein [Myxococcota bacterium]
MDKIALTEEEQLRIRNMKDLAENRKYYELLGVPTDSSLEAIKSAYIQQSRDWHPDRFFRKELGKLSTDIENIFMRLTEAHNILTDPGTRKAYDREHNIDSVAISSRIQRDKYQHRKGRKRKAFERRKGPESSTNAKQSIRDKRRERVLGSIRDNIETQERRAAHFFKLAEKDLEQERPVKAATSLHIACKLSPGNTAYIEKYKEVKKIARAAQAIDLFTQAENAESFQNYQEAFSKYRKAIEFGIEDARAYARLSYLMERLDPDPRETLRLMRLATQFAPDNAEYRCILGEMYQREGLDLNARREFQAALRIDKNYQRAKDGLKGL